ncbi:hypothetical protein ACFX2A_000538 [Malus domestica]
MRVSILIKKSFFFNRTKLILPWPPTLAAGTATAVALAAGAEEMRGGRLPRVRTKRRVGVGVETGAKDGVVLALSGRPRWGRVSCSCS